jgi:hypothetical protein
VCDGERGREETGIKEGSVRIKRCSESEIYFSYASGLMSKRSMTISASWVLIGAKGPETEREREREEGVGRKEREIRRGRRVWNYSSGNTRNVILYYGIR